MSNAKNITYIIDLLQQNKYKKALLLVKKLNSKISQQTYLSMSIEGDCHTKSHNFTMAKIAYGNAYKKATTSAEKIDSIRKLRKVNVELNDLDEVCRYLKQELEFDSSPKSAHLRLKLSEYSFDVRDFKEAEFQAIKLLSLNDFYIDALFALIKINSAIGNKTNVLKYLHKASIDTESLSTHYLEKLISELVVYGDSAKALAIINVYNDKYPYLNRFITTTPAFTSEQSNKMGLQRIDFDLSRNILSETKATSLLIKKLVRELEAQGAIFNNNIRIVEKSGNLSIHVGEKLTTFEELIKVPVKCMPIISDYQFSIDSKLNLQVQSNKMQINKYSAPIMKVMIDIYNATGKLSDWSKIYPLLTLKEHPQLLNMLIGERPFNEKIVSYQRLFNEGRWEQLLIQSFLGSRAFTYSKEMLIKSGLEKAKKAEAGLLAVIDFLNHKVGAPTIHYQDKDEAILISGAYNKESTELFIEYNLSDPLISYLMYGYIDTSSSLTYSIPITLQTKFGTTIMVLNAPSETKDKLNNDTRHLRKFIPENIKSNGRSIAVSSLIIPDTEHHRSLKEVLSLILLKYNIGNLYADESNLILEIKNLESQIIDFNFQYWSQLKISVHKAYSTTKKFSDITFRDMNLLCDFNINHLNKYKRLMKNCLY